jgi:RNA polymerase II subunit A small phosphatase-like protein
MGQATIGRVNLYFWQKLSKNPKKELNQEVDFKVFDYNVYKRPFLADFLNEIKDNFLLAIWSSASDDYVEEITKQIIPEETKLEFVWGRSRCIYRRNIQRDEYGYYNDDFNNHYHYIKPLKKVRRKGYRLNRILIVDDSPHKSKDNFGNAIYSKEFIGDIKDAELKLLAQYLKTLKDKENVRRIEKRNWQNSIK